MSDLHEELKDSLWARYETAGYQGERFMYQSDFDAALDAYRDAARAALEADPAPVVGDAELEHLWRFNFYKTNKERFLAIAHAVLSLIDTTAAPVMGDAIPNNCWLDDDVPCPSPCVFDGPQEEVDNCTYATMLRHAKKDKTECKYYRATPGTVPAPVVGDAELLRCYGQAKRSFNYEGPLDDWPKRAELAATVAGLRAVLARFGVTTPAPVPVPVSERPLLKSDPFNDDQGRCWCGTGAMVDTSGDVDIDIPPSWELREPCAQDDCVLPAHALPLPEVAP